MEIKFKLQASIALKQVTAHLGRAQHILTSMGRSAADKLQEACRISENDLRELLTNSLDAIVVANGKTAKFGLLLFVALKQMTVHLGRAQHILTSMGRSAADKLQEACRISENDLRELLTNSLDAIVVANGKTAKFGLLLFVALKQMTVYLGRAQHILTSMGRSAADKLQEACRISENDLRELLTNSLDAIVVANGKTAKFGLLLFVALKQMTVHLERAQHILTSMGRSAADKLQEACRISENDLRELLTNSLDAIVVANGKTAKFGLLLFVALKQMTVHLERAQHILTSMGRSAADKLQEARRTSENDLRELLANSLDAIVVANGKIAKFRSLLFVASKQMTVHLQRAQKTLTRLARNVIDKPRRLQQVRRTKENDLRKLLANSLDATVVTDGDHRLVYANPKALDLFGVSELNMRKFTIDTFLSHCQILELRRKWFAIRRDERYGKCKISRLDGSLRVAEYIFVANVTSRQDLYRFLNVAPPGITQLRFSGKIPISYTKPILGNQFGSSRSEKFPKSSLVN